MLASSDLGTGSKVFLLDKNTNLDKTLCSTQQLSHRSPQAAPAITNIFAVEMDAISTVHISSCLGQPAERFIRSFGGSHHHTLGYEVTEVNWMGRNLRGGYVSSITQKLKLAAEHPL